MKIKCGRCGKELIHPDSRNAYYITNADDRRTWGVDTKEKLIKAPLNATRVQAILLQYPKYDTRLDAEEKEERYYRPMKMSEFLKSKEVYPDEQGRREVMVHEEIERPKTLIICKECLNIEDTVIW